MPAVVDSFVLSDVQHSMLVNALSNPGAGIDLVHYLVELREDLDLEAFRDAWQQVSDRHPAIRASFWEGVDEPVQEIHQHVEHPFVVEDWRELSAEEQDRCLHDRVLEEYARGFDLSRAPLSRVTVYRCGDADYRVAWTLFHGVLDGRSCYLVLNEVLRLYDAQCAGEAVALPERPSYRGYVEWVRQNPVTEEDFWRERLASFQVPTTMGAVAVRNGAITEPHGQMDRFYPGEVVRSLQALAADSPFTVNTLVQAAWSILLSRYSGQRDVLFGVVKTLRRSTVPGADAIVGPIIAFLPLRVRVDPQEPLTQLLEELRTRWVELRAHERTPLASIQHWSGVAAGTPLFGSSFTYDQGDEGQILRTEQRTRPGARCRPFLQTNVSIGLQVFAGSELRVSIDYDRSQYDDAFIVHLHEQFRMLLERIASNADVRVGDLCTLSPAERQQSLETWNDTSSDYPRDLCLHELFARQVDRSPDAVAISDGTGALTYAELDRAASRLAERLRDLGVAEGRAVGLCAERSVKMMIGLLGILKAGAAYVPLDPDFPSDRLYFMLEDADVAALVADDAAWSRVAALERFASRGAVPCVQLDQIDLKPSDRAPSPPVRAANPERLAYLIYTSGSTGTPKGVQITHRCAVNFLESMRRKPGIERDDVLLAVTTLSFDIAVLELFLPLCVGAKVVIASRDVAADAQALQRVLGEEGITIMQATPATWQMLVQAEWPGDPGLKILCGGEALPQPLADALVQLGGELWNMYGPTETTVWSSISRVQEGKLVTLGRPIANTQLYVLDEECEPVAIGVAGELYIGGDGVARGYHGRPGLTAERFVPDPFGKRPGGRLYRTGDLVRHEVNGELRFNGRADFQVKVRGYRIELGEIEKALSRHPQVQHALVTVDHGENGDARLLAYAVGSSEDLPSPMDLRKHLEETLPQYMIPAAFVFLPAFPLNPSGKVDRRALPAPDASAYCTSSYVAPATETEVAVASLWEEVLDRSGIGASDDFFHLGGHSLMATQVLSRVVKKFGVQLPMGRFFQLRTVAELAAHIDTIRPGLGGPNGTRTGQGWDQGEI